MKKIYLVLFIIILSFVFISCSSSSRKTSEEIVDIINALEMKNIDQTFYQDLKSYNHIGDAYYLLGERNDYIELVMYYKQKYVQLIIEFDFASDETSLVVEQLNIEYFDLLDEIYIFFEAYDELNTYDFNDKTYDEFFIELEALSISDIEWILSSLELME